MDRLQIISDHMMNNNFSILLVLKDRPFYTLRFMSYLEYIKFPHKIIIADGGKNLQIQEILQHSKNFPNLNYKYIRYPYDETLNHFHEKMALATQEIQTPTVAVLDNDDFILSEGISKCLYVLKENDNYSSARGAILSAGISHDVYGHLNVGANMYTKYPNSIMGKTASDRMIEQTKRFHGNWHNITRSNHIKALWGMTNVIKPRNMRFTEQITGYLIALWGDGYRSDFPWLLHQNGQRIQVEGGTLDSHYPDQQTWINSDFWIEDFNKMTEVIGVAISQHDNIPINEGLEIFASSYHHKLPHLKDILDKRVAECRKVGYNNKRIEKLLKVVEQYNVRDIEPIGEISSNYPTAKHELEILSNFLMKAHNAS